MPLPVQYLLAQTSTAGLPKGNPAVDYEMYEAA